VSERTTVPAPGPDEGVYVISVAAQMTGIPAPTLRLYEDKGLLTPARTAGRSRRYSQHDIERIRRIAELSATGINLAGISLILELQDHAGDLRQELDQARAAKKQSSKNQRPAHSGDAIGR
jgi:MerR family transcriptional regulator/heat shock protein HspR